MATIQLSGAAYAGPNTAPLPAQPAVVVALSPNGNQVTLADMAYSLRAIYEQLVNPMSQDPLSGRVRVSVDNFSQTTSVITTTTLNNGTNIIGGISKLGASGLDAGPLIAQTVPDMAATAYATRFRGRII